MSQPDHAREPRKQVKFGCQGINCSDADRSLTSANEADFHSPEPAQMGRTEQVTKGLVGLALLMAVVVAGTTAAFATPCDPSAISVVSGYPEARDGGEHRRAQRYLSADFEQHFRGQTGAAYPEYVASGWT